MLSGLGQETALIAGTCNSCLLAAVGDFPSSGVYGKAIGRDSGKHGAKHVKVEKNKFSNSSNSSKMSTSSKGAWQKLFAGRHGHEAGDSSAGPSTSAIRAYLRLRPASAALQAKGVPQTANIDVVSKHEVVAAPAAALSADISTHSLVSSATRSSLSGRTAGGDAEVYTFTEVLPEDTNQASLYNVTARPLIENSLGAGPSNTMSDSLILAYGVSGGGKTCTSVLLVSIPLYQSVY